MMIITGDKKLKYNKHTAFTLADSVNIVVEFIIIRSSCCELVGY